MLRTSQLRLLIGDRILIDGLDLRIDRGQCWCIVGRNGAGKSSLLRTLAGLRQADGGTVLLRDRALSAWSLEALARERAFLPQSRSDAFGYRVIETVLSARHPYHSERYWDGSEDHKLALAALDKMDVAALAERDVRTLSGGERQRVSIAALLAQETPLLLLDEPANALDLAHQVSVTRLLAKLCRDSEKTVVMIGHDLNVIQSIATHVLLLMGDGEWQAGCVADVMQAPILSRFLGHPIDAIQHQSRTFFLPNEVVDIA